MVGLKPAGTSRQTGRKWVERFLEGGLAGLADRSHTRPPTARGAVRRRWSFRSAGRRLATIQAAMEAARVSTIRSV